MLSNSSTAIPILNLPTNRFSKPNSLAFPVRKASIIGSISLKLTLSSSINCQRFNCVNSCSILRRVFIRRVRLFSFAMILDHRCSPSPLDRFWLRSAQPIRASPFPSGLVRSLVRLVLFQGGGVARLFVQARIASALKSRARLRLSCKPRCLRPNARLSGFRPSANCSRCSNRG